MGTTYLFWGKVKISSTNYEGNYRQWRYNEEIYPQSTADFLIGLGILSQSCNINMKLRIRR
jgi:hypothetical protein